MTRHARPDSLLSDNLISTHGVMAVTGRAPGLPVHVFSPCPFTFSRPAACPRAVTGTRSPCPSHALPELALRHQAISHTVQSGLCAEKHRVAAKALVEDWSRTVVTGYGLLSRETIVFLSLSWLSCALGVRREHVVVSPFSGTLLGMTTQSSVKRRRSSDPNAGF